MTKLLAYMFTSCAGIAITLGQYWYVFGIWPRSWGALVLFSLLGMLNTICVYYMTRSER